MLRPNLFSLFVTQTKKECLIANLVFVWWWGGGVSVPFLPELCVCGGAYYLQWGLICAKVYICWYEYVPVYFTDLKWHDFKVQFFKFSCFLNRFFKQFIFKILKNFAYIKHYDLWIVQWTIFNWKLFNTLPALLSPSPKNNFIYIYNYFNVFNI